MGPGRDGQVSGPSRPGPAAAHDPASPCLVVVSGWPGAGKSSLARALSRRLAWPVIEKDAVKEALFDALGGGDRSWSRTLGQASYGVMLRLAAQGLADGVSCILEGNFDPARWSAPLASLITDSGCRALQVHCSCAPEMLLARVRERALGAPRHRAHADELLLEELREACDRDSQRPLGLPATLLALDTGAASPGPERLAERVQAALATLRPAARPAR